jgi:pimeloyl-ACP methyl ester carboxylesterase
MSDIQVDLHRDGLGLWLLRYRVRGWNHGHDELPSPVPDARWALSEVRREHGDVPVVLLGHSMGARTATAVADDPAVVGVVALAPWFPRDEPVDALAGKQFAAAHGTRDRITRLMDTRYYVQRAAEVATSSSLTEMTDLGHYLLRGRARWNRFAADTTRRFLLT